ncbi:MAG: pyridoxal-phosphate dependent enzyme, partial [Verrucomicrobia bacterium]|nr:pyridoxal-phosphate dependent enzyme [Verrucomicrobiota bacterium]
DSIKRVEIMAALRTRLPDAPEVKPEHLGSLQTLQQVVEFLSAGGGATAPVASSSDSSAQVAPASSSVAPAVLAVVAEKTGYPMEMLTLDMGLDRDLGIDSIKRVEIMAALRTRLPDAPEVKPEHLGSLQTLKQVVEFLTAGSRVSASASVSSGAPANQVESKGIDSASATRALLAVVAEKTGYPTEMLNLDMGLDSDLGIDSIKRVEIMAALRAHLPDAPEIKPEHLGTLRTLQEVVNFLCAGSSQGGTGHRPVPSGDSPDGTTSASVAKAAQLSTPEFSIIPVGGSSPQGVHAFVLAAQELSSQPPFDTIVFASSSGSTHSGLLSAFHGTKTRILGIACDPEPEIGEEFAELLNSYEARQFTKKDFDLNFEFVGPGYGVPSEAGLAAISRMAR